MQISELVLFVDKTKHKRIECLKGFLMVITLFKQNKTQITLFTLGVAAACLLAILTSGRANAACSVDTSRGTVTQTFTVPADQVGTYRVWARMAAGTAADKDSFYLEIDGGTCINFGGTGLQATGWKWVDYQNGNTATKVDTASLAAGTHTVKMIGSEDAVKIDKLLFVRSTSCVPTDMSGNPCLPDQTPPTVTVSVPASPLVGTKRLTATAADNDAIAKVTFRLNGTDLQPADLTSPYEYDLNTTLYTNGTYQLTAVAEDLSGNKTSSTAVSITINNPVPDTTKPVLSVSSPANGSSVPEGVVTVNATATDNVAVAKVEFFVDNSTTAAASDTTSPYSSGSSINLTAGSHTIKVVASDTASPANTTTVTLNLTVTATPVAKTCDFNKDNAVTLIDLGILINSYNKTVTINTNGDCNGDGKVTLIDLGILINGYGK